MGLLVFAFMLLFIACGVFQMAVTMPMIRRRVKPNPLYGFRTPKTLSNEQVWYDANAYAGWLLFASGAAQVIVAVALVFTPGLQGPNIQSNVVVYCLVCGTVTVVTVLLAVWRSNWYAKTL